MDNDNERLGGAKPTLKTIAMMTGLGIGSVSKALKDAPDISEKTKARVRLVAKQIGYAPDPAGIRLRTGQTKVIALVTSIDEDRLGFSSQFVFGASQALYKKGYNLMVIPHSLQDDGSSFVKYMVESRSADGLIISRIEPNDQRVRYLSEKKVPFVTHGRSDKGSHPWTDFDNEAFAYGAVKLLKERGRTRISIVAPPDNLSYFEHIHQGFKRAMQEFGLPEAPMWSNTDTPLPQLYQEIETLLRSPEAPDALICCAGGSAVAASAAITDCGRLIGEDFDLVSKESFELLHWIHPNIMVAKEDLRESGRQAAEIILARLQGEDTDTLHRLTQPLWVEYQSSKLRKGKS